MGAKIVSAATLILAVGAIGGGVVLLQKGHYIFGPAAIIVGLAGVADNGLFLYGALTDQPPAEQQGAATGQVA